MLAQDFNNSNLRNQTIEVIGKIGKIQNDAFSGYIPLNSIFRGRTIKGIFVSGLVQFEKIGSKFSLEVIDVGGSCLFCRLINQTLLS